MFASLGLHGDLERALVALGFEKPTPVQERSIPPAMEGRDVVACAQTGTGKTAAFLLPTLHRMLGKPGRGTRVLVLTPTRELAAQVNDHMRELASHTRLRGAAIYGGVAMGPQREALRRGVDVLVATPGRLLDHLQYPYANLDGIETLVLDEADRMLDMGFLPAIKQILAVLPKKRQTLLFSATMPQPIVEIARQWMHDPVRIDVERKQATADGVRQALFPVREEDKKALLLALLGGDASGTALVFTRTKHRADRLCRFLDRAGVPSVALHGNRSQAQRTRALADFRTGRVRVLVATDIAARGIDVEELGHVVNFDAPGQTEDYIHRVGRTGRAEAVGDAWTFVTPADEGTIRQVERVIGRRLQRLPLPPLPQVESEPAPAAPGVRTRIAPPERAERPAHAEHADDTGSARARVGRQGGSHGAAATHARSTGGPRGRDVRPSHPYVASGAQGRSAHAARPRGVEGRDASHDARPSRGTPAPGVRSRFSSAGEPRSSSPSPARGSMHPAQERSRRTGETQAPGRRHATAGGSPGHAHPAERTHPQANAGARGEATGAPGRGTSHGRAARPDQDAASSGRRGRRTGWFGATRYQ